MSVVAKVIGVSRSNLHERAKPRRGCHKAQGAAVLPRIQRLVAKRLTYGYRRITALLNRELKAEGLSGVNHKRVYRIMKSNGLLLERCGFVRPERVHDGKVVAIRSNLRWCSDGFEFACWSGEIIRAAFTLDTHDREIIAWRAVAGAGISGSDVRDMMLEAVEKPFGACRALEPVQLLSDNGSPCTARKTRIFAAQLGLKSCFTPAASPESNGVSEAFVKTIKRDYVHVSALPNPQEGLKQIVVWFEDYNENHMHSARGTRSPRGYVRASKKPA